MCRPVGGMLVAAIATTFAVAAAANHDVPFFPSAADPDRQGFVRIVNHASRAGTIRLFAIDDDGNRIGPRELTIEADEVLHFNSDDLEAGNPAKGLDPGTGPGSGDWRLELDSDLDIEVLAYIRTPAGFLAPDLDTSNFGLTRTQIRPNADIASIRHRDQHRYSLYSECVMSTPFYW